MRCQSGKKDELKNLEDVNELCLVEKLVLNPTAQEYVENTITSWQMGDTDSIYELNLHFRHSKSAAVTFNNSLTSWINFEPCHVSRFAECQILGKTFDPIGESRGSTTWEKNCVMKIEVGQIQEIIHWEILFGGQQLFEEKTASGQDKSHYITHKKRKRNLKLSKTDHLFVRLRGHSHILPKK